jgi:hypothetical protein
MTSAALADDGFGNLVRVSNPYGQLTTVFARIDGRVCQFEAGTPDYVAAIDATRKQLVKNYGDHMLRKGKWKCGPVLALINGGNAT